MFLKKIIFFITICLSTFLAIVFLMDAISEPPEKDVLKVIAICSIFFFSVIITNLLIKNNFFYYSLRQINMSWKTIIPTMMGFLVLGIWFMPTEKEKNCKIRSKILSESGKHYLKKYCTDGNCSRNGYYNKNGKFHYYRDGAKYSKKCCQKHFFKQCMIL